MTPAAQPPRQPSAGDGALPEAAARGYDATTPHPAASGGPARGEPRDKPPTGQVLRDEPNRPTGTVAATPNGNGAAAGRGAGGTPGDRGAATPNREGTAGDGSGLSPDEKWRLLNGAHHDPHALLGAHPEPGASGSGPCARSPDPSRSSWTGNAANWPRRATDCSPRCSPRRRADAVPARGDIRRGRAGGRRPVPVPALARRVGPAPDR